MLLWSIEETARQLGNVSKRTVQRLLKSGDLPKVKVLGITRIPPGAVCDWVERQLDRVQNPARAAPVVCKENEPCHTDAMTHQFGGPVSQTQKAAELDALLVQLTGAKPMPSKPSGSSKPTRRNSGGRT